MADKQTRRMLGFVHGRNGANNEPLHDSGPGRNIKTDDLKVKPTKSATGANVRHTRSHGQLKDENNPPQTHVQARQGHSQNRQQSKTEGPFWETDVESLGDASTLTSVRQSNTGAARDQQGELSHESDDGLPRSSSPGEESSGSGEELADDPLDPSSLNRKQRRLLSEYEAQKGRRSDGKSLPYMQGDSYATTTSGRPSVVSVDHAKQTQEKRTAPAAAHSNHGSTPCQQLTTVAVQDHAESYQPSTTKRSQPAAPKGGLITRPDSADQFAGEQDVMPGFSYAKATKQQPNMNRPNQARPQGGTESTSFKPSISANTAQPASVPATQQVPRNIPQQKQHGVAAVDRVCSPQPNQILKTKKRTHTPTSVQPTTELGHEHEQRVDREDDHQAKLPDLSQQQMQRESPEADLDYNPPGLFDMSYLDLKGQSFDIDPSGTSPKLSAIQQDDTLESKIEQVAAIQPEDQVDFFSSLPIDEWEQAGEWFLGQFSGIVSRLKDARQEKRKAAKQFEDEIEKRYNEISKKRKQTEDSLGEMKKSGGQVLQGTPKKARKA